MADGFAPDAWITVAEAARRLGIHSSSAYRAAERGDIASCEQWNRLLLRATGEKSVSAYIPRADDRRQKAKVGESAPLPDSPILRAAKPVTPLIVVIALFEKGVRAFLPEKNARFRDVVLGLDFMWNDTVRQWERRWEETTETDLVHRAAELAARLVHAGFHVSVDNAEVRRLTREGNWTPEPPGEVTLRRFKISGAHFVLNWRRRYDFWEAAHRIHGARYDKPDVLVPVAAWEEVEDFAEQNGFTFSPSARAALEEQKELWRRLPVENLPPLSDGQDAPKRTRAGRKSERAGVTPPRIAAPETPVIVPAHLRDDDE